MPEIFAGIRLQCQHRRQEEIVALAVGPDLVVPRGAVANTDIELIQFLIIDDGIPGGAAAATLPIFARPCGRDLAGHDAVRHFAIRAVGRVAGHREETPLLLAGHRVIGGHIAAHAEFAAAVTDHHQPLHHARCAGDGVGLGRIGEGLRGPFHLAGVGIQRDQPSIQRGDIHQPAPHRDTAIDDIAAGAVPARLVHLGIIMPLHLAGDGIQRHHVRP